MGARLAELWRGLFDAFVRDNKVLPPVLALLALLLFAWVAAGLFTGGLEGEGVSSGTRFDPQGKGLGEWLRARHVDVPEALLGGIGNRE